MTMKRNGTKEKIMENAYTLILEKGYPATTVDEICRTAGVSKGSFFHYFKTKEELGVAVLRWYYQRALHIVGQGPFLEEKDPMKRLFLFLDHTDSVAWELWNKGCLLGSFASYLAGIGPQLAEQVSALFNELVRHLTPLFEPVALKTAAENGPTAVELSEQFLNVIEGSIVLARAYNDWTHVPTALNNFRRYLKLIVS